jgi:hypothetical protein
MEKNDLPVKSSDEFVAEFETMDLSDLKDKVFLVAVSTGDRNKSKFLSTTAHGPYSFVEMVEEVGVMWNEHQHHAKVVILEKVRNKACKTLDENTVDYIEAHYTDIVTEAMLDGIFDDGKVYTCRAGIVDSSIEGSTAVSTDKVEEKNASE